MEVGGVCPGCCGRCKRLGLVIKDADHGKYVSLALDIFADREHREKIFSRIVAEDDDLGGSLVFLIGPHAAFFELDIPGVAKGRSGAIEIVFWILWVQL